MSHDLRIIGGTIVDGTGAPGHQGDVAVKDGRVVTLGAVDDDDTTPTIDASGKVVCPGFVDIHTHYDAQILWDPLLTISPWHGVTTVVMGNCGFGVAPTRAEHRDLIVRTLEKVEGMSADALFEGLGRDWPFETFPQYLDAVEASGQAINVGVLAGHTPLRLYVMGEESTEREATTDEIAQMKAIVTEALEAGALGFASSHAPTHVGYGGRPVPSRLAGSDEIVEIASALGEVGSGVLQATLGTGLAFKQFREIASRTGQPISWTALLAGMAGDGVDQYLLDESHKLVDEGLDVHPQVACRPLMFEFNLEEPFVFESMSLFQRISAGDHADKLDAYRDPEFRSALGARMAGKEGAGVLGGSWDRTVIAWYPPDPSLEERSVAELASEKGVDPTDLALDMGLATDLEARFRMAVANYDEDRVEELLKDPITMIGLSDAGAHASQLCDACFSTHLLSHWVRDRRALSLEEAVRMLTSEPAEVFGITDRGLLAEGRPADIVVFDPETVGASPLRRVHDLPAGADRLVSDASGIDAVVVNGTVIRRDGVDSVTAGDDLPGRLLRNGHAS
jgi:N-acyl-D-aspartate/D-glutamate deacylase